MDGRPRLCRWRLRAHRRVVAARVRADRVARRHGRRLCRHPPACILLGSIAGVFVDRWDRTDDDRRRSPRALLLLPLLVVRSPDQLWLLYLVRAATGTVSLAFDPAESALLPKLVGEERLVSANALNALNNNLGWSVRLGGGATPPAV